MSYQWRFTRELRRRRVFRLAALYVVAAWLVLQVASLALDSWGLPEEALRFVWMGGLLGFPLALVFSWFYDITASGIVRTAPAEAGDVVDLSLHGADYAILTALAVVAGGIAYGLIGEIREFEPPESFDPASRQIAANTIAVLPLENLSGDPGQQYFVDGMHEALITGLSKVTALRVTSRTSANVYRITNKLLPEIGRELRVASVIEGSVFRSGNRIRITLQLIDAATDQHLWARTYDRDIEDVLALQSEVARTVAREIRVELTPREETRLATAPKVDPATYELYLRGTFFLNKSTPEDFAKGMDFLHQAVERNPADPLAWAGLAFGYITLGHGPAPPPDAWPKARAAALRALKLDPDLAEGHAALADIKLYYEWDWEGAEQAFKRAFELNSSDAFNHYHYAWYLALFGRMDEAIIEHKQARDLDPFFPLHTAWLGGLYWIDGRPEEAAAEALKSLEMDPDFAHGLYVLGEAYTALGRIDEAVEAHRRMVTVAPDWSWALGRTYALAGREGEARKIAAQLEGAVATPWRAYGLVTLYAALGENDDAFRWLAFDQPHGWIPWVRIMPPYQPLRNDPRFGDFLKRLNLPG